MNNINIVLAANDRYLMSLLTTIYSVLYNLDASYNLNIYVIEDKISQQNKHKINLSLSKLKKLYNLIWLSFDLNLIATLRIYGHLGRASYIRLLIPEIVNEKIVIYMDCDIICNIDIAELYNYKMNGNVILAVQDSIFNNIFEGISNWSDQNLDPQATYFNTGFMIMDLNLFRINGLSNKIINNIKTNEVIYRFADQDGINATLCGQIGLLDGKWNVQMLSSVRHTSNRCIIHYVGEGKPWLNADGMIRDSYYFIPYYNFLLKTGYLNNTEYLLLISRLIYSKSIDIIRRKILRLPRKRVESF